MPKQMQQNAKTGLLMPTTCYQQQQHTSHTIVWLIWLWNIIRFGQPGGAPKELQKIHIPATEWPLL